MMHQYVCRGWGRNSPHYIVFYLYVVFTVKYEVFNVRINDRKVGITFVAIAFQGKLLCDVFAVFIHSEFGTFLCKVFISTITHQICRTNPLPLVSMLTF